VPEFPDWTLDAVKASAKRRLEHQRIQRVYAPLRAAYDECGYRTAGGRWAGGNHTVRVRIGEPNAAASTSKAWSRNGKWSGLDSEHVLTVRQSWPAIEPSARVVSGLLTLDLASVPVEPRIFVAVWVEQGRGTSLNTRHGFLVHVANNWVHADTIRAARAALKGPRVAPVKVDVATLDATGLLRRARLIGNELVLRSTAIAAGHCEPGIRDWCERHVPGYRDRAAVTTRELAELAVSSGDRVREVYAVLLTARREAQREAA
jgi:hypothetical protein